jgi:mono/diheme cytochrome c family protein
MRAMAAGGWLPLSLLWMTAVAAAADETTVDFVRDIKPIFRRHCVKCHGPQKQQAGLRLDAGQNVLLGGDSGPAFVAGDVENSLLLRAVIGADDVSPMPPEPDPPLSAEHIERLKAWVAQGGQAPADDLGPPATRDSDHWAFRPVARPPLPRVTRTEWIRNGLDAFIAAGHELQGFTPAPEADRYTLIRRLALDLTGVLPTPQEVEHFVHDPRPDAYESLVERLLASPHYGERWGRHWLDLARYADSNGFTRDMPRDIWKYREWVIDAMNRNLPFDRFAVEQLAGDLLPDAGLPQQVATGFHRNTLFNEEGGTDPEQFRVERTVDRVNTTSAVFLGLTIGCAQCHDHKYDPITQREYYQLYAFFNNADEPTIDVPSNRQIAAGEPERRRELLAAIKKLDEQFRSESWEAFDQAEIAWEEKLTEEDKSKLPFQVANAVNLARVDRTEALNAPLYEYVQSLPEMRRQFPLLETIHEIKQQLPAFATTMVMSERAEPRDTFVQVRGDFLRTGAKVRPLTPAVLPPLTVNDRPANRLDLARWLVSEQNPLTARVTVNRVWQRYFGRGLVETENDFGLQGSPPTHPELLDWLAAQFLRSGWDLKGLHRLIVTSATYRQSSRLRRDLAAGDPGNQWYARQSRLRLESEIIRDAALSAAGVLCEKLGGPSVYPPQPEGVFDFTQDKKPWPTATGGERFRRGMYTYLWRSSPYPAMTVFDFPDANVTCTRRARSNTPLQSLNLANDEVYVELARYLSQRIVHCEADDDPRRLERAFLLCLQRPPNAAEAARLSDFLQQQRRAYAAQPDAAARLTSDDGATNDDRAAAAAEQAAWIAVARVLLNLDEFITRE